MNDDTLPTPACFHRMLNSLNTERIHLHGLVGTFGEKYLAQEGSLIEDYGRLGMVGPVTNNAAAYQKVSPPNINFGAGRAFEIRGGDALDQFALQYGQEHKWVNSVCDLPIRLLCHV